MVLDKKMVRNYKRWYKDSTEKKLAYAVRAVWDKRICFAAAGDLFNVPKRTVYNKVPNFHQKPVGAPIVFEACWEKQLVDLLIASAKYGFFLTMFDLRMILKEYLDRLGKTVKIFSWIRLVLWVFKKT